MPSWPICDDINTSVDATALHHYMSWHSIVPAPRTILSGISKLPPATVRILDTDGQLHQRVYWQPAHVRETRYASWSPHDWQEAILRALQKAVARRVVADDQVGVLLSGGLDSSLIVALLAQAGLRNIPTFSVGFDAVGDAIGAMTEPMASHDVPAFYLHSQEVASHANIVQSGQGADEIFAGYGYHCAAEAVPRDSALTVFTDAFVDHTQSELAQMLNPAWLPSGNVSHAVLAEAVSAPGAETAVDAVLRLETQLFMAEDPVKRVNNMTSVTGLEASVPFLDHQLVELVAACPTELKTAQGGKGILKDIGRTLLPSEVIDRPKGYFPVPALRHLQDPILSDFTEALHAPEARERTLFQLDCVKSLLVHPNEHYLPTGGNALWRLDLLELWLQRHDVG